MKEEMLRNTAVERAENEVRLACKRENPDWDGKEFDYGCSCYQSALKAYKSLCEEIGRKLTAISDEPIFDVMYQPSDGIVVGVESSEYDVPLNIPIEQFLRK